MISARHGLQMIGVYTRPIVAFMVQIIAVGNRPMLAFVGNAVNQSTFPVVWMGDTVSPAVLRPGPIQTAGGNVWL